MDIYIYGYTQTDRHTHTHTHTNTHTHTDTDTDTDTHTHTCTEKWKRDSQLHGPIMLSSTITTYGIFTRSFLFHFVLFLSF
jgi:energy-converting hydrogenase Eha subunit H